MRLFAFLAVGIVVAECVGYNMWVTITLAVSGLALIITPFIIKNTTVAYRLRHAFGIGSACILAAIGMQLLHDFDQRTTLDFDQQQGIYEATITTAPIEKERSVMCHARLHSFNDSCGKHTTNGKVILYIAKDSAALALRRGTTLLVSTAIGQPHLNGNPEEFDYGTYLRRQGIGGTGYVPTDAWHCIGQQTDWSILSLADACRNRLLDVYRRMGLSGNEFGMLAALTLGYKDALTSELRESFSTTGASHVLAVSGLHVGIIYAVLNWLLSLFLHHNKRNERIRSTLIIAFLWFYAFITGLSPSVMRATVMFSFMALGGIFGRKSQTYNTIFLSAFVLLLYRPTLLFDVGFQLSYSAVLAIIYFQPRIVGLLYVKHRVLRWAWELTAVSLAAQIGTAPLSVYYFHQFPNYFLLSNFVVIPAATLILYTAILLFAVAWIPYVCTAVAWLLNVILKSMYFLITCIESLPHALSLVWIDAWQVLLLYIAIIACGFCCYRLSFKSLATMLTAILAIVGLQLWHNYTALTTNELIVFNHSKTVTINKITRNENLVLTNDSTIAQHTAADHWQRLSAPAPHFVCDTTLSGNAFTLNNKRCLLLNRNYFRHLTTDQQLTVDYLIVNRTVYPSEELLQHIHPNTLITTGDVYARNNAKFRELSVTHGINFYAVKENGALLLR
ncbi:MAG: ComEC/Rec2 family competence protein [Paludibacteraceae bacterium]